MRKLDDNKNRENCILNSFFLKKKQISYMKQKYFSSC